MTFIDLFSGIGGFRLGMEMAGNTCLGHCEKDVFANYSYTAMHLLTDKELENLQQMNLKTAQQYIRNRKDGGEWFADDITRVRADELPTADCWCFGFPCQDISVAGKQTGFKGNRSSLFFAVTRLIRNLEEENKPSILFIENVKNLLSVNGGWDFAKLLIELDEIGYDAEWQVINSKDFGVPQNRERVFIIGHLRGRGGQEVFPIGGTNATANIPIKIVAHHKSYRRNSQVFAQDGITETLSTAQGGGRGHYVEIPAFCDLCYGVGINTTENARCLQARYGKGMSKRYGEVSGIAIPVLTPDRVNKRQNGRRFKNDGEPSFTLTSQDRHGVYDGVRIRRLTPLECFRLQGFLDKYFYRATMVNSDSQVYKQAGNSVTVNVIYEIAKRLEV